jgi:hypothetical protein
MSTMITVETGKALDAAKALLERTEEIERNITEYDLEQDKQYAKSVAAYDAEVAEYHALGFPSRLLRTAPFPYFAFSKPQRASSFFAGPRREEAQALLCALKLNSCPTVSLSVKDANLLFPST